MVGLLLYVCIKLLPCRVRRKTLKCIKFVIGCGCWLSRSRKGQVAGNVFVAIPWRQQQRLHINFGPHRCRMHNISVCLSSRVEGFANLPACLPLVPFSVVVVIIKLLTSLLGFGYFFAFWSLPYARHVRVGQVSEVKLPLTFMWIESNGFLILVEIKEQNNPYNSFV